MLELIGNSNIEHVELERPCCQYCFRVRQCELSMIVHK